MKSLKTVSIAGAVRLMRVLCLCLMSAVLPVNAGSGGRVVAWGDNGSGQTTIPLDLTGVTAIAAGAYHTV
ncbi:MAG: hypothetical protein NT154_20955, partial [Verrucomicrobia bacterium]|nr:hypothetical protein [Verrucomicrobiota bacterium]